MLSADGSFKSRGLPSGSPLTYTCLLENEDYRTINRLPHPSYHLQTYRRRNRRLSHDRRFYRNLHPSPHRLGLRLHHDLRPRLHHDLRPRLHHDLRPRLHQGPHPRLHHDLRPRLHRDLHLRLHHDFRVLIQFRAYHPRTLFLT